MDGSVGTELTVGWNKHGSVCGDKNRWNCRLLGGEAWLTGDWSVEFDLSKWYLTMKTSQSIMGPLGLGEISQGKENQLHFMVCIFIFAGGEIKALLS